MINDYYINGYIIAYKGYKYHKKLYFLIVYHEMKQYIKKIVEYDGYLQNTGLQLQ